MNHFFCLVAWSWEIIVDWEACPSECGLDETTLSRYVVCFGPNDEISNTGDECEGKLKPEVELICDATKPCGIALFLFSCALCYCFSRIFSFFRFGLTNEILLRHFLLFRNVLLVYILLLVSPS